MNDFDISSVNDENLDPALVATVNETYPIVSHDIDVTNEIPMSSTNFNRYNLVPGSLLDAKDNSNIWYQACVTEIKYVDKPISLVIDIDDGEVQEFPQTIDVNDIVEELIEEEVIVSCEKSVIYSNIVHSNKSKSATPLSSQDKSSVLEVLVGVVDEVVDSESMKTDNNEDLSIEDIKFTTVCCKENDKNDSIASEMNAEVLKSFDHYNTLNLKGNNNSYKYINFHFLIFFFFIFCYIDPSILMDDNASDGSLVVESHDITPCNMTSHVDFIDIDYSDVFNNDSIHNNSNKDFYVRVSFLGWGERYDEWINIDSEAKERLQEFNLLSHGNRGDGNIREEIISLVWNHVEDNNLLSNILPNIELKNNAILRKHCFLSPYYVDVVNTFIENNGFLSLFNLLRGPILINEKETDINISSALHLIIAMGKTSQVLSKSLLINQYDDYLTLSSKRLKLVTHIELRQLPIELLESSLTSIELFCNTYIGKSEEIKYIGIQAEILCLEMSLKLLSCPYLNKRLGGLKLLSDLIKKVNNFSEYPLGFVKTVSFNSDNIELISYRNLPISRNIKLNDIFARLVNTHVINDLFIGDQAHDSLIDRCNDILSSLAKHGYLVKELVDSMWEAAFVQRNQSSLKSLVDVISCMDPSMLLSLVNNVSDIDCSLINNGVVDMIAAIGDRGLDILMTSSDDSNINSLDNNLKLAMDLHSTAIKKLWRWAESNSGINSGINSTVISRCIMKLETALSINIPFSQACKNNGLNYSWDIQWLRSYEVIEWTIDAINSNNSLDLALKVLQSCIFSWPQMEDFSSNNTEVIIISDDGTEKKINVLSRPLELPFIYPVKSYVVEYIEQKYNVLEVLTNAIVDLISSSIEVDVKYKEQLERCFDFIHIFIRCADVLIIKQEYIDRIWTTVVNHGKENSIVMDALINFLYRMIMQSTSKVSSVTVANESTPTIEEKRSSICSFESVQWIFDMLLCDVNNFIKSPYYSVSALACTEKYFRWLNLSGGFLLNVKKAGSLTFVLIDTPSSLIGLNVFSEIILSCISDQVANQTVKFLTSLPSKLSTKLVKQGELINFNNILLDQCIQNLHLVNNQLTNSSNNISIKRLFMLLGGLINESSSSNKSVSPFKPHGNLTKGKGINIKVSYSGKIYNYANGIISVFENDILEDVVKQIAKKIFKSVNCIKIFYKGKDIVSSAKKTLLQLSINEGETFMIAFNKTVDKTENSLETSKSDTDKNKYDIKFDDKHIENDNVRSTDSVSLDMELINNNMNDFDMDFSWKKLPSIVLSHNNEYFTLLLQLLNNSYGTDCDVILALINLLPTSPYILCKWMDLDCNDISDIFINEHNEINMSLSNVFYNLQIIDFLLEPMSSVSNLNNMNIENLNLNAEFDWINHLNLLISSNENSNVSSDNTYCISKLLLWPLEFINKNGILALESVMVWLTEKLLIYIESIDTGVELNGISSQLLLNSIELCSKIIRSFFIFSTYYKYPNVIKEVLSVSIVNDDTTTSTTTSANATADLDESSVKFGPHLPPSYSSTETIHVDSIESIDSTNIAKDSICDEAALMNKEWGKQLQTHSDILLSGIVYSTTQKNILVLMSLLRKFCNYDFFINDINYDNNGYDSNLKSIGYQSLQELIIKILNNLLVVWNCIVVLEPSSLSFIKSSSDSLMSNNDMMDVDNSCINLEDFLKNFLVGTYKYDKEKSDSENNKLIQFNDKIGEWTIKSINNILSLASFLDVISNDVSVEAKDENNVEFHQLHGRVSPLDSIRKNFVLSLLSMRPSLLLDNNDSFSFSSIYNPVFTIMNKIIKENNEIYNNCLSNDTRVKISQQVLKELEVSLDECNQYLESSNQKLSSQKICYLDGNINLLIALSNGYDCVLQALYDNGIVNFLIVDCLGLEDDCYDHVLFIDNKSKEKCYKLLNILCEWNNHIANDIISRITKLHNSLKLSTSFLYKPEQLSISNTSYVGIRNMGSTCYMNCLLQILFMNPLIQLSILETPINTTLCQEEINNNIIIQLKKMFCYLKYSNKKYFVPDEWVYCFKDQDGVLPINVMQQQDAQEFLLTLCDRLEVPSSASTSPLTSIPSSNISSSQSNSSNSDEDIERNTRSVMDMSFGGQISNQMILDIDPLTNSYSDIREQEEKFYCITLNVKDCKDLEDSLNKYIEGEQINDFNWNEGLPKATITKRNCFTNLSDTLIFHLKRFEFNFDTFLREKVNDFFPFPMKLNMLPYTKEGIYNTDIKVNCYYEYELSGIVVHTGTTNSGHYYSYIKDDTSNKWFEFNDSEITELNECNISKECFGGTTSTHEYNVSTNTVFTNDIPNPKSAYMLIYRRVVPEYNVETIIDKIKNSNNYKINNYKNDILAETQDKISKDNKCHDFELKIYSSNHISFVQTLMDNVSITLAKSNKFMNQNIFFQFTNFYLRIVSRSSFVYLYNKFAEFFDMCMKKRVTQYEIFNVDDDDGDNVEMIDTSVINIEADVDYDEDEAAAIAYSLVLAGKSNKTIDNTVNNFDDDISTNTSSIIIEDNIHLENVIKLDDKIDLETGIKVDDMMVTNVDDNSKDQGTTSTESTVLGTTNDLGSNNTNDLGSNNISDLARGNDEGYLDVASLILSMSINNDFDNIFELLYSSDTSIRMSTAKIIFTTYHTLCQSNIVEESLLNCFDEFGINNDLLGNNSNNPINIIDEDIYSNNSLSSHLNKNNSIIGNGLDSGRDVNNTYRNMVYNNNNNNNNKRSSDWTDDLNLYSNSSKNNQNNSVLNEDEELAKAIRLSEQEMVRNGSGGISADSEAIPIFPSRSNPNFDELDDEPPPLISIENDVTISNIEHTGSLYSGSMYPSCDLPTTSILHTSSSNLQMLADVAPASTSTNNEVNLSKNISPACYFLYLITKDKNIRQIAENWRKSDAHVWLLLQICQMPGHKHRDFLIKREIIGQLIDIYLSEQSPLSDNIYTKGTRKIVPSSYVSVGPGLKSGELPTVGKNIPNFIDLLNVVSILIHRFKEQQVVVNNNNYNFIHNTRSVTASINQSSGLQLSKVDMLTMESRTFFCTLLLQHRYHLSTRDVFVALSRGNYELSETIIDVLFEAITMAANDCTYHIFFVLEGVLAIEDNYSTSRSMKIFNATGAIIILIFILILF
jgi:ubiquitin C-terminal hydrolase